MELPRPCLVPLLLVSLAACGCGGSVGQPGSCQGVVCDHPPADVCLDALTVRIYNPVGRCEEGACTYDQRDIQCAEGCAHGACAGESCEGVTCDPPPNECLDAENLRVYTGGTCIDGTCEFFHQDEHCIDGCASGACGGTGERRLVDRSGALPANRRSTTDVRLVDLDGDGDLDIVWVSQPDEQDNPGGMDISVNQGGGTFVAGDLTGLEDLDSWSFVLPLDVDDDGDTDLVLSRPAYTSAELAILLNDGGGRLALASGSVPEITGNQHGIIFGRAAAGDIDGDEDPDLVLPVFSTSDLTDDLPNLLLLNDGSGVFTLDAEGRLPAIPEYEDYTLSVAVGDVTGDGRPDIFLGEAEHRQRLLVNDGTGTFADQSADDGMGNTRLPADDRMRSYHCMMTDINGDGDLDILVVSDVSTGGADPVLFGNHVFHNDGLGYFVLESLPAPTGAHDSRGLDTGDINHDGIMDVILGNAYETVTHGGAAVEVLLGQPNGVFRPLTGLPSYPEVGVFGVAVGDLNADGYDDIAAACAEPAPVDGPPNILLLSE